MSDNHANHPIVVRETEILPTDPPRLRLQKLARITLDSMIQFVGLLDAKGTVLEINKVALDAAGIKLSDVEGKPFWTTFWWQVSEEINATLQESIARAAQGELVRWDTPIYGSAGGKETIIIDASLCPVLDDHGNVVFICAEGRDITAKKAQEREIAQKNVELQGLLQRIRELDEIKTLSLAREQEAREQVNGLREAAESANRAKDEFLRMLGHELRNPLSPIVTALQLMKLQGPAGSERARTVIERQVNHLIRLVDDLLDVSRITRGKVELKKEVLELAEVIATAIETASPLLEKRGHALTVDVPRSGLLVNADPTRLGQVVSILLTNAAKYTPPVGRIIVRAQAIEDEVVLSVRDTGIGIAPEVLPRVFDLFFQERQTIDRSQGGLGLGLMIVRNLVQGHGGSVLARSEGPKRGSEIIVRLPRLTRDPELADSHNAPTSPADAAGGVALAPRVLVVDDNEDAAETLNWALVHKGYDTRVAHDASTALRVAAEFLPDIAVVDIGLPMMDGYELASHLRAIPGLAGLRFIALTGYGQESDHQKSQEAGFAHHLVKPVDIDALEDAMGTRR
jgi:PAS domain S-box-containing protein